VIAAEPPRIFNREAMRAILRWKFRPRIVDGQPVSREAEQVIEFKIGTGAARQARVIRFCCLCCRRARWLAGHLPARSAGIPAPRAGWSARSPA
jgi:hypothetical protein